MWVSRLTVVALFSFGSIACSHQKSSQPQNQPENQPESVWSLDNITVQPRKGLPPPDPETQKVLKSIFSSTFVQTNGADGPNSPERFYCVLGKLAQSKVESKKSSAEWLQQIVLLNAQLMGQRDSMGEALYYILRMYDFIAERVLQINGETFVEVLAPLLDSKDQNVAATAKELLEGSAVLNPYTGFGNGQPFQFYDIANYLRKPGTQNPPWTLIALMYKADAEHAFETLAQIYLQPVDAQVPAYDKLTELKILQLSQSLAIGDAEKIQAWQIQINGKLQELSQSPHWCVRMYALELLGYPFELDSARSDIAARLSKDSNPMVARRAKELLKEKAGYEKN